LRYQVELNRPAAATQVRGGDADQDLAIRAVAELHAVQVLPALAVDNVLGVDLDRS
jgi:hypothetical protein